MDSNNKNNEIKLRVVHKKKTLKTLMTMYSISMIAMAVIILVFPEVACAKSTDGATVITNSFKTLIDIVTALISSIGTLVLMWGFFEWGTSMQSQDGVMQSSAFKRIGGGLVMVLAPQLVTAFVSK